LQLAVSNPVERGSYDLNNHNFVEHSRMHIE
jgi:hypothetical protein